MEISKVEVQDYDATQVRIVIERGEEAPAVLFVPKADLPPATVRDGKVTRSHTDTDETVKALLAERNYGTLAVELVVEYASSLRVDTPETKRK